ncbi:MAG: hypothetical protein EBT61_19855 [Verrucomicrobia bacterium]|nr:hypothetical protein [Verrucomicrobiota bacterium]
MVLLVSSGAKACAVRKQSWLISALGALGCCGLSLARAITDHFLRHCPIYIQQRREVLALVEAEVIG